MSFFQHLEVALVENSMLASMMFLYLFCLLEGVCYYNRNLYPTLCPFLPPWGNCIWKSDLLLVSIFISVYYCNSILFYKMYP